MTPLELKTQAVSLILQHLSNKNYQEAIQQLEEESGVFFNMKYFEELVKHGDFDEADKYLSRFTTIDENLHSKKVFFEIRKQKFLEALDRDDKENAEDILDNELKFVIGDDEHLFEEMKMMALLDKMDFRLFYRFRDVEMLSSYVDINSVRADLAVSLKSLIHENPAFQDKLLFSNISRKRLLELLNQSLCWQDQLCLMTSYALPRIDELKNLLVEHTSNEQRRQLLESFPGNSSTMENSSAGPSNIKSPMAPMNDMSFVPQPASITTPPEFHTPPATEAGASPTDKLSLKTVETGECSMTDIPFVPQPASITTPPMPHTPPATEAGASPTVAAASSEIQQTSTKSPSSAEGFVDLGVFEDFPRMVVAYISQESLVSSMAFHPKLDAFLLVGTYSGDISVWDVRSKERFVHRHFEIEELSSSEATSLVGASVNCLSWSHKGTLFGVGYSKRILQIYRFVGRASYPPLQIDAHAGSVTDLTFAKMEAKLCVVTCGDDKTVKVWDSATGSQLFTFKGHQSPVRSVCTHHISIDGISNEYILSGSADGEMCVWRSKDNALDEDASYPPQGISNKTMRYSDDECRLFSISRDRKGVPSLSACGHKDSKVTVWEYKGLGKSDDIQFDTTQNKYLAVGDEAAIKFWHFDSPAFPVTIDFVAGLPDSPRIKFNHNGTLLAVSTIDNAVKILANTKGKRIARLDERLCLKL